MVRMTSQQVADEAVDARHTGLMLLFLHSLLTCSSLGHLIYATADEADAYIFYRCFFLFLFIVFLCFLFFSVRKKYETTVLGNG